MDSPSASVPIIRPLAYVRVRSIQLEAVWIQQYAWRPQPARLHHARCICIFQDGNPTPYARVQQQQLTSYALPTSAIISATTCPYIITTTLICT